VIENCYDRNTAPMLAVVRSFNSPLVQASVDTGHAFGMQQVGGPPPDQWIRDAGALLGHVHLQDTDGHGDRHWAPGEGNVNWFAVFEALGELAQAPRLLLEIDRVEKAQAAAERLAAMGLAR
jgi:sugar phosphate isomerase/epimerase